MYALKIHKFSTCPDNFPFSCLALSITGHCTHNAVDAAVEKSNDLTRMTARIGLYKNKTHFMVSIFVMWQCLFVKFNLGDNSVMENKVTYIDRHL